MAAPDFWSNRERAQTDVEEVSRLRSLINPFQQLEREIEDFSALQELAAEESNPAHRAQAEKEVLTEIAMVSANCWYMPTEISIPDAEDLKSRVRELRRFL